MNVSFQNTPKWYESLSPVFKNEMDGRNVFSKITEYLEVSISLIVVFIAFNKI